MKKIAAVFVACSAFALAGCSDEPGARRALENMGMTDIQINGYSYWGCGKDDTYHTAFKAKNAQGNYVSGVVCSDWWKGSTVRFD